MIKDTYAKTGKKTVVIGHSKGGLDTLQALVTTPSSINKCVTATTMAVTRKRGPGLGFLNLTHMMAPG